MCSAAWQMCDPTKPRPPSTTTFGRLAGVSAALGFGASAEVSAFVLAWHLAPKIHGALADIGADSCLVPVVVGLAKQRKRGAVHCFTHAIAQVML